MGAGEVGKKRYWMLLGGQLQQGLGANGTLYLREGVGRRVSRRRGEWRRKRVWAIGGAGAGSWDGLGGLALVGPSNQRGE